MRSSETRLCRLVPFPNVAGGLAGRQLLDGLVFDGVRGGPALDVDALAEALSALSRLAWNHCGRLAELDVNPVFVRPKGQGIVAADALVVLGWRLKGQGTVTNVRAVRAARAVPVEDTIDEVFLEVLGIKY